MNAMDPRQWEILQQMLAARQGAAGVHGMPGTPGGPVQESPTMRAERNMQGLPALAAMLGLTGAGMYAGAPAGPIGMAVGGLIGSNAAELARLPLENANSANIRDVWADQLRMKMQGR